MLCERTCVLELGTIRLIQKPKKIRVECCEWCAGDDCTARQCSPCVCANPPTLVVQESLQLTAFFIKKSSFKKV